MVIHSRLSVISLLVIVCVLLRQHSLCASETVRSPVLSPLIASPDVILDYEIRQDESKNELTDEPTYSVGGERVWRVYKSGVPVFSGSEIGCGHKRVALLKAQYGCGRINLRFTTMGGKQYWADVYVLDAWRIQYHVWTKHFRLLNSSDVRCAWGSWESCRTALAVERIAAKAIPKKSSDVIILLHGILRSKDSMKKIENYLHASGREVINLNYPSRHKDLPALAKNIHFLLNQRSDIRSISFVTHSMGGLLLRELMRDQQQPWRQRCELKAAVMLFPPNQGAYKANQWHERWWYKAVMGVAGQRLCSVNAQALPTLPMPLGIIVGSAGNEHGRSGVIPGDDDGTVGVKETHLQAGIDQPLTDYVYHVVSHTFGMNNDLVIDDIAYFLQYRSFVY